ncbi:MAG: type II toxin-antitoxin system RelE/ParE family toxin [Balneolaceae bacterium]|nr:type II toxin-antitoxin system RelE/ParE family toxin [Balneolaceae bacterium]
MNIEWSSQANADAIAIIEYISKDNPSSALALIQEIDDQLAKLIEFPEMGRVVPELNSTLARELIVEENYRVIYTFTTNKILVASIRHVKRKPLENDL